MSFRSTVSHTTEWMKLLGKYMKCRNRVNNSKSLKLQCRTEGSDLLKNLECQDVTHY